MPASNISSFQRPKPVPAPTPTYATHWVIDLSIALGILPGGTMTTAGRSVAMMCTPSCNWWHWWYQVTKGVTPRCNFATRAEALAHYKALARPLDPTGLHGMVDTLATTTNITETQRARRNLKDAIFNHANNRILALRLIKILDDPRVRHIP